LSLFLNTASDEGDVTSFDRPFHAFAPAAGKARPPTVDQVGTSGRLVEADVSLRRCGMSATHVNDDATLNMIRSDTRSQWMLYHLYDLW